MDLPSSRIPGSIVESIAAESMMLLPWLCVICYVYLFLLLQGGQSGRVLICNMVICALTLFSVIFLRALVSIFINCQMI